MKTRSTLILTALLAVVPLYGAAEDRLAFPETQFEIVGPLNTKAWGAVVKNSFSINSQFQGFQSGTGRKEDDVDLGSVHWRHLTKTEYGDVYIAIFETASASPEVIPVLFDGKAAQVITRGAWTIKFTKKNE